MKALKGSKWRDGQGDLPIFRSDQIAILEISPSWSASSTSRYVYPSANAFAVGGLFRYLSCGFLGVFSESRVSINSF